MAAVYQPTCPELFVARAALRDAPHPVSTRTIVVPAHERVADLFGVPQRDAALYGVGGIGGVGVGGALYIAVGYAVGYGIPHGVQREVARRAVHGIGGVQRSAAVGFGVPAAKVVARARGRGQRIYLRTVDYKLAIAANRAALRVEVQRVGRPLGVQRQRGQGVGIRNAVVRCQQRCAVRER